MSPRINPIDPSTVTDPELAAMFEKTLKGPSGKPINIFGTLAHHPKLLDRFNRFGGMLLNRGLIPERERELVILRVGWNCRSVYEFGQHTIIGERAGLTAAEIAAICESSASHDLSEDDSALLDMADDLCRRNVVSDATWARLTPRWNQAELIELVIVAGFYRLVSGFLNTMGVELDEGVPGWPASAIPNL